MARQSGLSPRPDPKRPAQQVLTQWVSADETAAVSRDAIADRALIENLGVIYACTAESEQACNQLALGITNVSDLSYGQLRLNPFWHSLRDDPDFEKIVAMHSAKFLRVMDLLSVASTERSLSDAGDDLGH